MKSIGYYNGKLGPIEEMTIPMNDRVVYFGDGVYEATLTVNRIPFALEEHFDRFYSSLRLMRIDFGMTRDELKAEIMRVVDAWGSDDTAMLYWQVTRGTDHRHHEFPDPSIKPNLLITIKPYNTAPRDKRLRLITEEDTRFFHCNIKTLNLIPNVMAAQKTVEAGCDECVFHRGDMVTECAHSNVHILKNGVLKTHAADNLILPGITRLYLVGLARQNGIPVDESGFTVSEMMDADEVIVSASGLSAHAACEIDGKPVGGKAPELLDRILGIYYDTFDSYVAKK